MTLYVKGNTFCPNDGATIAARHALKERKPSMLASIVLTETKLLRLLAELLMQLAESKG